MATKRYRSGFVVITGSSLFHTAVSLEVAQCLSMGIPKELPFWDKAQLIPLTSERLSSGDAAHSKLTLLSAALCSFDLSRSC